MRIDYLKIPNERNLKNFEVNFDERAPMTVVLGGNGAGKSNLIENIIIIFRELELGKSTNFAYEMQYYCYGNKIQVISDPNLERNKLRIIVNDSSISVASFRKNEQIYLPANIFAYYSGSNERLENIFAVPTKRYYKDNLDEKNKSGNLRRFFLCRKEYAQFAFFALFFEDHALARFIRKELLRFESFESALFVLKQPWWASNRTENDFFWGARGTFKVFMQRLREASFAPIKNKEQSELDVRGRKQNLEYLYLYIRDQEHFQKLREPFESTKLLFGHLENLYLSDLLEEIRITGKHKSGSSIRVDELSEGERQLVIVFGLLLFAEEDETLFLLDEPDSHLNPQWVYQYVEWLRQAFLSKQQSLENATENPILTGTEPTIPKASQVILATHNPLMIGSLTRNQVRIMSQTPEGTTATEPEFDPLGFGADGLLTSDFFGLDSVLPNQILEKMSKRNKLYAKKERTDKENSELKKLSFELSQLGILKTHLDPLQQQQESERLQAIENSRKNLTPEEIISLNEESDKILDLLFSEEGE